MPVKDRHTKSWQKLLPAISFLYKVKKNIVLRNFASVFKHSPLYSDLIQLGHTCHSDRSEMNERSYALRKLRRETYPRSWKLAFSPQQRRTRGLMVAAA